MLILKIVYHLESIFELLFFKFLFGERLIVGKKTTWRKRFNLMIDRNAKVVIGENCFFNNDCSINAYGQIKIGNGSVFGENVKIYDHNHRFSRRDLPIKEQGYVVGSISIGEHCWIGSNVTILKGTEIEDFCVIGAGTVIKGKIPAGSIVKNISSFETISIND